MATEHTKPKTNLSNDQRSALYHTLLKRSTNGVLSGADMLDVCASFHVNQLTVWRIWKRENGPAAAGPCADICSRKQQTGRKKTYLIQEIERRIKAVPLAKRQTFRALAAATELSTWTLWNYDNGHFSYGDAYREYLLTKVLPAIKSKWVWPEDEAPTDVYVQQDNARPHVSVSDAGGHRFIGGQCNGWAIKIINQPPKSPDLNIFDLGFFNAIQSLQQTNECKTVEDLIRVVRCWFVELRAATLAMTFGTLQRVVKACVEAGESNVFKIPSSKDGADISALDLMHVRLEQVKRMDDLCGLLESCSVDI
ncbi:hypothetical protein H257_11658 [Aphanomyces astaci]|uniref:DUF7769 domain-containing protein n=1 Tax=Aphanomyces astaci TaxID=112090 RepID=W4G3L9_APHAT|nr:hypothetical protein H257_11658 [Aphanomyces astaci]ETV73533.1 hypothetical protein H257_11658 [Aphanomyces astaci]|eukprot:XP_009836959.1 hypothetical protein H257_11658 [Aphanomyces astaci]